MKKQNNIEIKEKLIKLNKLCADFKLTLENANLEELPEKILDDNIHNNLSGYYLNDNKKYGYIDKLLDDINQIDLNPSEYDYSDSNHIIDDLKRIEYLSKVNLDSKTN